MRTMTLPLVVVALFAAAVTGSARAAGPIKVTISAPAKPKVNVPWAYSVKVVDAKGKPVAAKLSMVVIDPVGGVHPVEFFKKKPTVTNYPINGTFSDKIIWPPASVGYVLKLKATARAGGVTGSVIVKLIVK